jgi:hypothetical protein
MFNHSKNELPKNENNNEIRMAWDTSRIKLSTTIFTANPELFGRGMVIQYLNVTIGTIIDVKDVKTANTPKSPGLYSLVIIGTVTSAIILEITAPEDNISIFLYMPDILYLFLNNCRNLGNTYFL